MIRRPQAVCSVTLRLTSSGRVVAAAGCAALAVAALAVPACTDTGPSPASAQQRQLLAAALAAEDSRPDTDEGLEPILLALASEVVEIRRFAVRGLGRLERPSLAPNIASLLADQDPGVRSEAAHALAQAVYGGSPEEASGYLLDRLPLEHDAGVRGALAVALGRLPYESDDQVATAESALLGLSWAEPDRGGSESAETVFTQAEGAPADTLIGVARGFEALARRRGPERPLTDESRARLAQLAGYNIAPQAPSRVSISPDLPRVRRLAFAALNASGGVERTLLDAGMFDPDDEVRRLATAATARVEDASEVERLLTIALGDASFQVRTEALRVYAARLQSTAGCGPLVEALQDPSEHNILFAIHLLGQGCPEEGQAADLLSSLSEEAALASVGPQGWHRPATALVELSRVAPQRAAERLPTYAEQDVWQVRMYAAQTAANLQDGAVLERLARDDHPNVREAAIAGLQRSQGHAADPLYIGALASDDYQLLITASRALAGSEHPDAVPTLLEALRRITAQQRETSRDPRRAMIVRVGELGASGGAGKPAAPELVEALSPYLRDFDPVIARAAASILTNWTGTEHRAEPRPLPRQPYPSLEELETLAEARAFVHLQAGGTVELRLLPFDAPTNAARFARLARSRYFDGLTFHRVVPNFVIQGGSPGANEYMGDGPYTRDEITSRSHLRGTVGLSTRGRDTGDAQIFVNLVDNVRLDHNFTIYAEVVSGMEVFDAALEGATIERIEIVGG